jgi:uncharacterized repeat protein (TIGR03803 family)
MFRPDRRHTKTRGKTSKTVFLILLGGLVAAIACANEAAAGKLQRAHSFCKLGQPDCDDGAFPQAGLVADPSGNLYGTTYFGGLADCGTGHCGTVFELSPTGAGKYAYARLYSFCSAAACADGVHPYDTVIVDTAGNLYGTASGGGKQGAGTIFELVLNGNGSRTYKVLHDFCSQDPPNCTDGGGPESDGLTYKGAASGAPYDGVSPLYGTALAGGPNGLGVVYQFSPPAAGKTNWHEKVLYSFCTENGCADGRLPQHGLLVDSSGNLYGSTTAGGPTDNGVLFELSKSGGTWSETVLYNICADNFPCATGSYVGSPLVMDGAGNLYGTMADGGDSDNGVIFKLAPNGANSTYSVLYNFCSEANCEDGQHPWGAIALDSDGGILGAAQVGGAYSSGLLYKFRRGNLHVLHAFCRRSGCPDGQDPLGGIIRDASGNLYGTTANGGKEGEGVVFRLTP